MMSGSISLPILTRIFSTSEYGLLALISLNMFFLIAIAKFGMQHSAVRFFDEFRLKKRNVSFYVYYSTLFWGSFIIAVIVTGLFIMGSYIFYSSLFKGWPDSLFWIIGGLVITEALFIRIENFLRIEQKAKLFVLLGIVHKYGKIVAGLIFLFFLSRSVQGFLMGTLFLNIIVLLVVTPLFFGKEKLRLVHFSRSFLKENIIYGYPMIGFELSSLMMKFADRYLIQMFIGASAVGLYSAAGNLSMEVSSVIFSSVWLAVSPIFMQIWNEQGDRKTQEFLSKVIKFLALISIPMIFGLTAISKDVIVVFATTKFQEAAATIPFLIAGAVLWGFCPITAAGLFIHKKTKILNLIVLVGTAVNIVLNLIMIPQWDIIGAAVATFITYVIVFILTIRVSFRYLKINIELVPIAQFIFAALCMYFILIVMPLNITLGNLILKIAVGAVSYGLLLFLLGKEVREMSGKILPILLKAVISKVTNRR